jgi:hypothetical protein
VDLRRLVETAIDSAIRGFDPEDPGSYDRWDLELERVEDKLRRSTSELDPLLLSSVCAERIRIASEARKYELVSEQTAHFLREFPASVSSFSFVASLRLLALHALGEHKDEVREGLEIARSPELQGSEYVALLSILGTRHPGCLPPDEELWQKLQRAVDALRAQGYKSLSRAVGSPMQLEDTAGRVSEELRRVNREHGESLLSTPS